MSNGIYQRQLLDELHHDEYGLFSVSNLAATLFFTVLVICAINVGMNSLDQTQEQRQVDAIAESLGTWKARHLNAVVAHQHLMGEMLALVITHHAIGGDLLDRQSAADTQALDQKLTAAYLAATAAGAQTPRYDDVSSPVLAEEALLVSHKELKKLLTYVYLTKVVALAMQKYPPTAAAGVALEQLADLMERMIGYEWDTLEAIRKAALKVTPLKLAILQRYLPDAKLQLDRMIADYSHSQQALAEELGRRFELEVHILPSDRRLPLIEDPLARLNQPPTDWAPPVNCNCPSVPADNMRHQLAKVTQLSRATFPWVNYHRDPLVRKMKPLTPLSGMGNHYFDATAGVSKRMMDELQRNGQLALYTLDDYRGPDKAYEEWIEAEGASAADKTFGITVLVGQSTSQPIAEFLFRKSEADWNYRYASAIVWNRQAPEQPQRRIDLNCKRIVPTVQAQTGWDTLNWLQSTELPELVGIGVPVTFPAIKPSWTSRLTPTSAARVQQLQEQSLPSWGDKLRDVLPQTVSHELVGI